MNRVRTAVVLLIGFLFYPTPLAASQYLSQEYREMSFGVYIEPLDKTVKFTARLTKNLTSLEGIWFIQDGIRRLLPESVYANFLDPALESFEVFYESAQPETLFLVFETNDNACYERWGSEGGPCDFVQLEIHKGMVKSRDIWTFDDQGMPTRTHEVITPGQ